MKPTSFAALAVVTALAMVVAIATYGAQNRWSQAKVSGASLAPNLAAQSSRIAKIEPKQGERP
jgi:Tfp pilus assembly protein PilN